MASNTEQRKIDIIVNGQKANASVKEMEAAVALLNNQWKKTERGTDEYVKKSAELNEAKKRLREVRSEVNGVDEAQKEAVNSFAGMIPFKSEYDMLTNKVGLFSKGIGGASKQFGILKLAIASTGLGLLIIALGSLVTYLTSTQDGMDKVTSVTRPLMALFDRLIGVVQQLGGKVFKGLADAISNPKQALIDLADVIKDNVMARFQAFGVAGQAIAKILDGDVAEGFKELGDAVIQGSTGIRNGTDLINDAINDTSKFIGESIDAGKRLDELQKTIERSENALIVSRAKLNVEYNKQKEIAQDLSKSEQERVAAAKAAQAAQNAILSQEQNFLDLKIEKMELEHSLNDTSREDEKELANLIAERTNFEAEAAKKRASAKSLENTAAKANLAEEKKIMSDRAKAQEEALQKELEAKQAIEDLKIALIKDKFEQEIAQVELDTARKIEALTGSEEQITEQRLLLEEQREERLLELQEEQKIAREEKALEEMELKLEQEEELEELEKEKIELKFQQALLSEHERDMAFLDLKRATAAEKLKILEAEGKAETAQAIALRSEILKIDKEKTDAIIENAERYTTSRMILESKGLDASRDILGGAIELLEEDEKARKKHFGLIKAMKVSETIIGTIKEVASVWETAMQLGPIAGPIVGGVLSAISVARGAMAVGKIKNQKFAVGGFTGSGLSVGSKGLVDETGYRVAGVVHQDEWVGPKWMVESPRYANVIGWLENERRRGFADGGYTSSAPIPTPNQMSSPGSSQSDQIAGQQEILVEISQKLDALNESVANWPTIVKVVNPITNIVEGIQAYNEVNEDSEISA